MQKTNSSKWLNYWKTKSAYYKGLIISLLITLGFISLNQLASLLFLSSQAIPLHLARPWTWVLYASYYSDQPVIMFQALGSFLFFLLPAVLISLAFYPGKHQEIRRYGAKIASISLLIVLGYGEFWSLLTQAFYPMATPIYPWHTLNLLLNSSNNPHKLNVIIVLTFITPLAFIAWVSYQHYQNKKFASIFGDAHWATAREVKKMGLFESGDIVIGWFRGRLMMARLVSHLLLFAPSRSGKGVSQVIPNALIFKGSLLVADMKQEIYEHTSGFRHQHGQAVFLFSPGNPKRKTHCWNPLDFVSNDPGRLIGDLQNIIEIIVQKTGKETDAMWVNEARALALGLLVWLKDSGRPFTLGELNNLVKGTPDFSEYLKSVLESSVIADNLMNIDPVAYMNLNNFLQKAEKEQSGVKSNLTSCLTLWDDPYIVAATSKSDFDIRDMRKKPMTVYLGIPANQLERLAPIMNLFVQQFVSLLSENIPCPEKEPYRVLAILDEFTNLGKMTKLRKSFSYLAGYHVHLMPVIQNIAEFYAIYGKDESDTFFQNTDYKIMYRQNAKTDKEFVSSSLGDRTIKIKTQSHHKSSKNTGGTTTGENIIKRPLLSPDEVGYFPKEKAIIQLGGEPPVKFKRIIYYKEAIFKSRLLPPVEIPDIAPLYPTIKVKKVASEQPNQPSSKEQTKEDLSTDEEIQAAVNVYQQIQIKEG